MFKLRILGSLLAAPLLALSACQDSPDLPLSPAQAPLPSLSDGANAGNQHFFFLPPITKGSPTFAGEFDGSLSPGVRICELAAEACVREVAAFDASGASGSEVVRVDPAEEHYIVNWHTQAADLAAGKVYRIRVSAEGQELGHADVLLAGDAQEMKRVDAEQYVPLQKGRTLPIKFRIEKGALLPFQLVDRLSAEAVTVHINPRDPVFLTAPTRDGEVAQFMGERGADGMPSRMTSFAKFNLNDPTQADRVIIGSNGMPETVLLRDGSRVDYEFVEPLRVKMTVRLADGTEGIRFFDLSSTSAARTPASPGGFFSRGSFSQSVTSSTAQTRVYDEAEAARLLAETKEKARARAAGKGSSSASTSSGSASGAKSLSRSLAAAAETQHTTVRASITMGEGSYSTPVQGAVVSGYWYVGDEGTGSGSGLDGAKQWGTLPLAQMVTPGVYLTEFSYQKADYGNMGLVKSACNWVQNTLETYCAVVGTVNFFVAASAACGSLAAIPGAGLVLAAKCEAALLVAEVPCAISNLCTLLFHVYDNYVKEEYGHLVTVDLWASHQAMYQGTMHERKSATYPFPQQMDFAFNIAFSVQLFTIPEDPAPYQGYVAYTHVSPPVQSFPVVTFMSGTDGYTQSGSGHTDAGGLWGMYIPGAVPGVVDQITTTVNGIQRQTSIVF